jgi:hypothetical protein
MSLQRRRFLKNVWAGLLGSAGFLLPAKLRAFPFRRRRVCAPVMPCPPPVFYPYPPECPLPSGPPLPEAALGDILVSFPSPSGTVYGSGTFCTWGKTNNNAIVDGVLINGGAPAGFSPISGAILTPCTWAFIVRTGLAQGSTFTLAYTYHYPGQPMGSHTTTAQSYQVGGFSS